MAEPDQQTATTRNGGFLEGVFDFADGLFQRWMDYERFDAESDLARAAAGQNLQSRQNSINQQQASISTNQMLTIAAIGVLAIVLLKKL